MRAYPGTRRRTRVLALLVYRLPLKTISTIGLKLKSPPSATHGAADVDEAPRLQQNGTPSLYDGARQKNSKPRSRNTVSGRVSKVSPNTRHTSVMYRGL